jgi:hypothetical protein
MLDGITKYSNCLHTPPTLLNSHFSYFREESSDSEDEEVDPEAALGAGKFHNPLSLDRHGNCAPLRRGFLRTQCCCIMFMSDHSRNFEVEDLCCVAEGGEFESHLKKQREDAESDSDGLNSFQANRDPNDSFRYRLYAYFVKEMELLGTGRRIQLPLCYVNAVREIWPSQSGEYVGFVFK